ncbi:MarR family transcriptional regulator [Novosphingobium sp.]|uniref:MarR family winged helix-turn-helix transcriptional regulator n=1 Tax=Novosphingobium sp. TaxID=1874826 RepID=UPI0031D25F73
MSNRDTRAKRPQSAKPRLVMPTQPPAWTKNLEGVLGYQLRRAQEASFAAFSRRVGEHRIWPGWYSLLKIIHDNPQINQTELSQAIGRDKSTMTASLRELTKAGLVERERDPNDKRSFHISLTPQGLSCLEELHGHATDHEIHIEKIVGQENHQALIAILADIAEKLS